MFLFCLLSKQNPVFVNLRLGLRAAGAACVAVQALLPQSFARSAAHAAVRRLRDLSRLAELLRGLAAHAAGEWVDYALFINLLESTDALFAPGYSPAVGAEFTRLWSGYTKLVAEARREDAAHDGPASDEHAVFGVHPDEGQGRATVPPGSGISGGAGRDLRCGLGHPPGDGDGERELGAAAQKGVRGPTAAE